MAEALINRMPEILTAFAALVASIAAATTAIMRARTTAKLEAIIEMQRAIDAAQQTKLDTIGVKVDGGMKSLQEAVARIAEKAVEQTRAVRKTDP